MLMAEWPHIGIGVIKRMYAVPLKYASRGSFVDPPAVQSGKHAANEKKGTKRSLLIVSWAKQDFCFNQHQHNRKMFEVPRKLRSRPVVRPAKQEPFPLIVRNKQNSAPANSVSERPKPNVAFFPLHNSFAVHLITAARRTAPSRFAERRSERKEEKKTERNDIRIVRNRFAAISVPISRLAANIDSRLRASWNRKSGKRKCHCLIILFCFYYVSRLRARACARRSSRLFRSERRRRCSATRSYFHVTETELCCFGCGLRCDLCLFDSREGRRFGGLIAAPARETFRLRLLTARRQSRALERWRHFRDRESPKRDFAVHLSCLFSLRRTACTPRPICARPDRRR